jgi:hypothetical protein
MTGSQPQPNLESIKSSNLSAIGYDGSKAELHVRFKSGATYVYEGVPASVYASLIAAKSTGAHFKSEVKDKGFKFHKVEKK